jgi:hypothetical protein
MKRKLAISPIWVRESDMGAMELKASPRLQALANLQLLGERLCQGSCTLLTTMRPF